MKLLVDTHVFIWWVQGATQLSRSALAAFSDPRNTLHLSAVSVWEIQIKLQLSKVTLGQPLRTTIDAEVSQGHFQILPLKLSHVFALQSLPLHHGDPFDRMLAAQTADEQMTFVTKDAAFLKYGIPLLW